MKTLFPLPKQMLFIFSSLTIAVATIGLNNTHVYAQQVDRKQLFEDVDSEFVPKYYEGHAKVDFADKKIDRITNKDKKYIRGKLITLGQLISIAFYDSRNPNPIQLTNFRRSANKLYLVSTTITLDDYDLSPESLFNYSHFDNPKDDQVGECSGNICRAIIQESMITRIVMIFDAQSVTLHVSGINDFNGKASGMSKFGDYSATLKQTSP